MVGALVSVVLPELLSGLAEYRLLFFGAALLVILWVAPEGVLGLLARLWPRRDRRWPFRLRFDVGAFLTPAGAPGALEVRDLGITFGGIKAATAVTFTAPPGKVTSVIGPNGAGKTTVLNLIGGFYRPDSGSIRLGERELAGRAAWKVARAGIARTYQTTKLFATMSILDNVLIALRRGRLGSMAADAASRGDRDAAEALLAFVGYHGSLSTPAGDLPHVDRRLVEIARALAMRPRVLLLDEPAAGLMRSDKDALSRLIRRIADLGIAVILVEHDMLLVMGISDAVIVLDAGVRIAAGSPIEVRHDPRVLKAYLGGGEMRARPRATPWSGAHDAVLTTVKLTAGYGAAPVLDNVSLDVRPGEMVTHHRRRTAPASRPPCARSRDCCARSTAPSSSTTSRSTSSRPTRSRGAGWRSCRRAGKSSPSSACSTTSCSARTAARTPTATTRSRGCWNAFRACRSGCTIRAGLLSGGEQQMLAIARGLMAKPRILLLDEPSLGLAPAMINELFDILAGLRDEGVTILLVDQMAALALTVADRGYVLELGKIVRSDNATGLADDPELEAAYLGRTEAAQ